MLRENGKKTPPIAFDTSEQEYFRAT